MKLKVLGMMVVCSAILAVAVAPALSEAAETIRKPETRVVEIKNPDFKIFTVPRNVKMYRASFSNQYGMEVVGHLFVPENLKSKAPAVVIGHPMGASKEQASDSYGSQLASRGIVALAMDQIFWGESGGIPRHGVAPDLFAETFNAGVDFLGTRDFVDRNRIGILGICGSGSFTISAAKIDPRIKAIATVSMYNIGKTRRDGLGNSQSLERRKAIIAEAANARYSEFLGAEPEYTGGSPFSIDENANAARKSSYDFYRNRAKFVPDGENYEINTRSNKVTNVTFMNFYPFQDIETISPRPMLFIVGEKAHSNEFSEDAYARAGEPKELYVVKGADHFDLYDKLEFLPLDKLEKFYKDNLK